MSCKKVQHYKQTDIDLWHVLFYSADWFVEPAETLGECIRECCRLTSVIASFTVGCSQVPFAMGSLSCIHITV